MLYINITVLVIQYRMKSDYFAKSLFLTSCFKHIKFFRVHTFGDRRSELN